MIQILLLWWNTVSGACMFNADLRAVNPTVDLDTLNLILENGKKAAATETLVSFCAFAWFLMHVIGGIFRSMLYIEPYFDNPDSPDDNPVFKLLCE